MKTKTFKNEVRKSEETDFWAKQLLDAFNTIDWNLVSEEEYRDLRKSFDKTFSLSVDLVLRTLEAKDA